MDDRALLKHLEKTREYVSPVESPRTTQLIGVVEANLEAGNELNAHSLLMHLITALGNIEKAANKNACQCDADKGLADS